MTKQQMTFEDDQINPRRYFSTLMAAMPSPN